MSIFNTDYDLYAGLLESDKQRLLALSRNKDLSARDYLFHQHSEANSFYIIDDGVLMVERSSMSGRRQIMAFLVAGNFFGFNHNALFEYSVQSLTDARLLEFPRQSFLKLCAEIPQIKKNVDVITGKVMLRLFDQLFALGQKKAHERLCFLLQQIKERQTLKDCYSFELVMTRQDIADYLGLTLETVSRAFTRLQKDGIITVLSAHHVEIIDTERLQEMAFSE